MVFERDLGGGYEASRYKEDSLKSIILATFPTFGLISFRWMELYQKFPIECSARILKLSIETFVEKSSP